MTRPDSGLALREVSTADLDAVERLLAANDLPSDRLRERPVEFVGGYDDGDLVAAGGLELHGTAALLRSVVVEETHRGRGCASAVCDELEAAAVERGVDALYLLTTTAAGFFERRGFEETPRGAVPEPVRDTPQFTEQCPESATCMRKPVGARK